MGQISKKQILHREHESAARQLPRTKGYCVGEPGPTFIIARGRAPVHQALKLGQYGEQGMMA
jgi:hypothetical protein